METTLRQVYKGIAYCYFHKDEKSKREMLNKLVLKSWNMGYPRTYFDRPTEDITIGDMTIWEIGYSLKDVIDISSLS